MVNRNVKSRFRALLLVLALCPPAGAALAAPQSVVLELFTSNGCSSCPPAYTLLSDLRADPPVDGVELILLNLHVDYWNSLGWVDPFSGAQYTERQRGYAREVFGSGRVYTPQLVVNGAREMVGSRRREVVGAIEAEARSGHARVAVFLDVARRGERTVDAHVALGRNAAAGPVQVWLALTQDGVVSHVGSGENGGRSLREDGVVRQLVPARGSDAAETTAGPRYTATLTLPERADAASLAVVAFVQRVSSHAIVGATRTPLGWTERARAGRNTTAAIERSRPDSAH